MCSNKNRLLVNTFEIFIPSRIQLHFLTIHQVKREELLTKDTHSYKDTEISSILHFSQCFTMIRTCEFPSNIRAYKNNCNTLKLKTKGGRKIQRPQTNDHFT